MQVIFMLCCATAALLDDHPGAWTSKLAYKSKLQAALRKLKYKPRVPRFQVRLAAGVAIAALLEGPQQKAYLAIAELQSSERKPARYSIYAIVSGNTIA